MRHVFIVYARDLDGPWVEGPDGIRRVSTPFITKVNEALGGQVALSDVTVRCYDCSWPIGAVMTIRAEDFNARGRGVMVSRAVDLAMRGLNRGSVTSVDVEFEDGRLPVSSRYERSEVV